MILAFEMGKFSSDNFLQEIVSNNQRRVKFIRHNRNKRTQQIMNNGIIPGMKIPFWDELENNIPCDAYLFQGLMRGADKIYRLAQERGKDFYFIDHPYFFRKEYIDDHSYMRFVKNDFSISKITNTDPKKYDYFRKIQPKTFEIKPWQKTGSKIIILPPSYWLCHTIGLVQKKLLDNTINTIKQFTDREIVVRYKMINGIPNSKSFDEELKDAHCVVSMQTNAATTAVLKGIPSFTLFDKYSPAVPVSLQDLSKIETPLYADNREEWLINLCNHNYTKKEIISGDLF